jgi:hypothetical protein
LKPDQKNSLRDPIPNKPLHKKRAGWGTQGEGPEFKAQYCQKKMEDTQITIIKNET